VVELNIMLVLRFKSLMILFPVLWFGACTSSVLELPETNEKIIVQAEFTDAQSFDLYIFRGIGIPINGTEPVVPDSVEIRVMVDGLELETEKINNEVPHFLVHTQDIQSGAEFDLRASIMDGTGIKPVRASTSVPSYDRLENTVVKVLSSEEMDDYRKIELNILFNIDGQNLDRYYELKILQEAEGLLFPPQDTVWTSVSNPFIDVVSENHILPPGINWLPSRNAFLIDYYKLEAKRVNLSLEMKSSATSDLSRLRMVLKSHTYDGYEFIKSFDKMQSSYQAEFPILVSNIQNGIGIFTAYAQTEEIVDMANR